MGEYADMAVDDALNGHWEDNWEWADEAYEVGWMGSKPKRQPGVSAPPGSPLARARMRAHQVFDRFWQSGQMSRKQAYRWLARQMGIPVQRCHIILFSEGDCMEVVKICSRRAFREEAE